MRTEGLLLENYNTPASIISGGGLAGQLVNQLQGAAQNQNQQLHSNNTGINNNIVPRAKVSNMNINTMQMNSNSMDREKELEVDSQ